MKVLIVGSGGREHALAWRLSQTDGVEIHAAPGNPGIARLGECHPVRAHDGEGLLSLARTLHAGLDGWPFGSIVPYAVSPSGDPVVFLSDIAEHTKNLEQDARAAGGRVDSEPNGVRSRGGGRARLCGLVVC